MKTIKFIRHGAPAAPYTDYSKITFEQITDLATEHVTPKVHPDTEKFLKEKFSLKELKFYNLILVSPSKRTQDTARVIKEILKKKTPPIKISPYLKEIYFNPKKLTTKEKYQEKGMLEIRKSLFEGMLKGEGADSLETTLERAALLRQELEKLPEDNILCITHSFFMRFLRLYFLENISDPKKISASKLMNTLDHSYLEGFVINL